MDCCPGANARLPHRKNIAYRAAAGHPDVQLLEFDGFDHGNMPQAGHYVVVRYIRDYVKSRMER